MKTIGIMNGPNLGALGRREPEHYGAKTLEDLEVYMRQEAQTLGGISLDFFQSNHEGELIDRLYAWQRASVSGVVLNPGALGHTSLALHDAVVATGLEVVEVHISHVIKRSCSDPMRRPLVVAPACRGLIIGLGFVGYALGLRALCEYINIDN